MMKLFILSFIISCSSIVPLSSMEKINNKTAKPSLYSLPQEMNREKLLRSVVLIDCGAVASTGTAYGDRYIVTAAHSVAGYFLKQCKIECFHLKSIENNYPVLVEMSDLIDDCGVRICHPKFVNCNKLQPLNIINAYIHPETRLEIVVGSEDKECSFSKLTELYHEAINFDSKYAEKTFSNGVGSSFRMDGEVNPQRAKTYGPDIVVLECDGPHGLPTIEISDPIEDERSLVHILGLAGRRYQQNNPNLLIAGSPQMVNMKNSANAVPMMFLNPKIYGQRFKCLPVDKIALHEWINRPFMKIIDGKYYLEDEVYPNSPDGFGLIANGDSGAGCVIFKDGIPRLVAIASTGYVEPSFIIMHNLIIQYSGNKAALEKLNQEDIVTLGQMTDKYIESLNANLNDDNEKNKRWFITQKLADLTHLKPWIETVTNGNSRNQARDAG